MLMPADSWRKFQEEDAAVGRLGAVIVAGRLQDLGLAWSPLLVLLYPTTVAAAGGCRCRLCRCRPSLFVQGPSS